MEFPGKPKVIKTFSFASKSSPGEKYKTEVWDNGKITCDCPSYKKCWHKKSVEEYLRKEKFKKYV